MGLFLQACVNLRPRNNPQPATSHSLPRAGNAEEAFEVTAGDFEEVGGGEPEGAKEAFGVAGKVKREMTGAGRRDAGEGEIL